jgi:hypothetical protein
MPTSKWQSWPPGQFDYARLTIGVAGVPLGDAVTSGGVRHGSGDVFGAGILTRGVLLDLAGVASWMGMVGSRPLTLITR